MDIGYCVSICMCSVIVDDLSLVYCMSFCLDMLLLCH